MHTMAMRGIMLDPARTIHRHSWYEAWSPCFKAWGYNTIFLNLADDSGCAIELERHPELVSAHAWSRERMSKLVKTAGHHGIEIIPIVASFGHTGYIYWRAAYHHLGDGLYEKGRKVLCPASRESRRLLKEVLEEVIELFPSPNIHVGLDEVGTLPKTTCPRCRRKFGNTPGWKIFAEQVQWLHGIVTSRGKRMMMWADFAHGSSQVADRIPRDIVLFDWQYEPDIEPHYLQDHIERGFDVVAVPAVTCWPNTTILPHRDNLANLRNFSRIVHDISSPRLLGQLNTVWMNTYNLFGTTLYATAYGGAWMQGGNAVKGFGPRFCAEFFGANDSSRMAAFLYRLHVQAPLFRKAKALIWLDDDSVTGVTGRDLRYARTLAEHGKTLGAGLRAERRHVTRHREVYDAYILAADIIRNVGERGRFLEACKDRGTGARAVRSAFTKRLVHDARRVADRAWKNWDLGFYVDHPLRRGRTPEVPEDLSKMDIDRNWYINSGNKNLYLALETSAAWLERTTANAAPRKHRRAKGRRRGRDS